MAVSDGDRGVTLGRPVLLLVLGVSCLSCFTNEVTAQPIWNSENVALLTGDNYTVDDPRQTTMTVEHASAWAWGDLFGFADITRYHDSDRGTSIYSEITPRVSMSWLTDSRWSTGIVKDVLIATTVEMGSGPVENLLLGPGLSLDVAGFDFLNLNIQYRIPHQGQSQGWMLGTAWAWRTAALGSTFVFDGYADWIVTDRGGSNSNLHFSPQLKFDLGPWLGISPEHWYAGIEYDYWSNKYGIPDSDVFETNQNTLSAMVQLKF